MLLFLSLLGIFLSAILIYFNARKNPSIIYLGFSFLLMSPFFFPGVLYGIPLITERDPSDPINVKKNNYG